MNPQEQSEFKIDLAVLAELIEEDPDGGPDSLLNSLIGLFLLNTPPRLRRIREAAQASDFKALFKELHTLKSNCGNLGMVSMTWTCRKLESAPQNGDLRVILELAKKLESEYIHAQRLLEAVASEGISEHSIRNHFASAG